jgi:acetyltransferase
LVVGSYPKKYATLWKLRNGRTLLLRPIKPEDEPYMGELFKTFSEETVRHRFFQILKEMSHAALARYCNVDYDKEIAIVAETKENGRKRLLGVVRLATESDGKTAEIAVVVGDPWQRLGLGSKLVDYIIEIARDKKLRSLYALMLRENYKAIRFMEEKGFRIDGEQGETVRGVLKL